MVSIQVSNPLDFLFKGASYCPVIDSKVSNEITLSGVWRSIETKFRALMTSDVDMPLIKIKKNGLLSVIYCNLYLVYFNTISFYKYYILSIYVINK